MVLTCTWWSKQSSIPLYLFGNTKDDDIGTGDVPETEDVDEYGFYSDGEN